MVDDLFALSRVQGAPEPRELSLVALSELVSDVASEAEAPLCTAQVRLEVNVPEHDNLAVLGRHDDLSRASATWSVHHPPYPAPADGLQVSADRAEDGSVRVAVRDGCGGIPDAYLDRVFATGWRGSPSRLGRCGRRARPGHRPGVVESRSGRDRGSQHGDGLLLRGRPAAGEPKCPHVKVLLTGGAGFIRRRAQEHCVKPALTLRSSTGRSTHGTTSPTWSASKRRCKVAMPSFTWQPRSVSVRASTTWTTTFGSTTSEPRFVLRAAAAGKVQRLVYASSMVVYGEGAYECPRHGPKAPPPRTPADLSAGHFDLQCPACGDDLVPGLVPESAPFDPRNTYAATKVHGEHLADSWARETDASVVALRFHNVYGPGLPVDTPYAGVAALFRSPPGARRSTLGV